MPQTPLKARAFGARVAFFMAYKRWLEFKAGFATEYAPLPIIAFGVGPNTNSPNKGQNVEKGFCPF